MASKNTDKVKSGKWRPQGSRIVIKLGSIDERTTQGGIIIARTIKRDDTMPAVILDFGPMAGWEYVIDGDKKVAIKQIAKFKVGTKILVNKSNVLIYMDPSAHIHEFIKDESFIVAMWEEDAD